MKKIAFAIAGACLAFTLQAQTGKQIMQKVRDAQNFASTVMELNMTLVDKDGASSSRTIQTLTAKKDGRTSTVTLFMAPASVKNTKFLSIENKGRADDQWIFLPSLGKVKRIAASERSGSFMGSDFSYSDMASTNMDPEEGVHELLREEPIGDTTCYVIESLPKEGTSDYGRTLSWVAASNDVVMKVEFYAADRTRLVKTLTASKIEQIQGHWLAREMSMASSNGHKTVIAISKVKFDLAVDPGYFTEYFLETGRTK